MMHIKITVHPGENFTAAGLMKRYADHHAGVEFRKNCWGTAELVIDGKPYRYHHWSVSAENGADFVTLYLDPA